MVSLFGFDPQQIIGTLSTSVIKLTVAVLILLLGFIIGKLLGRFVLKMLGEVNINKVILETLKLKVNADQLASHTASFIIYFLSVVAALDQLGLANTLLYIISIAIIIVAMISFFLTVKDFFPNVVSGIYLHSRERMKEGVELEIDGNKGRLVQIELLHTKIKTRKGDILYIPNSTCAKANIKILK